MRRVGLATVCARLFAVAADDTGADGIVDPSLTMGTSQFVEAQRLLQNATAGDLPLSYLPLEQPAGQETARLRPMWLMTPEIRFEADVPGRWHSKTPLDQLVMALLNMKHRGYFVDLASNHPVYISNTRALERDYDWNGICIEANPRYWALLRAVRRCHVVGAAVGSVEQTVTFVNEAKGGFGHAVGLTSSDGTTGTSKQTTRSAPPPPPPLSTFRARTIPFGKVLASLNAPKTIDYLSLDVEGAEKYVMESFPFDKHVIAVLTIETVDSNLAVRLEQHGYGLLCEFLGEEVWTHASAGLHDEAVQKMVQCGNAGMRCEPLVKRVPMRSATHSKSANWTCDKLWDAKSIARREGAGQRQRKAGQRHTRSSHRKSQ